jgi:membrane carboxypeptidase/penicillin-binding protein PbpC
MNRASDEMRTIAQFVSFLALWLLRREWMQLRPLLAKVYRAHKDSSYSGPTVLAQQLLISGEDHRFFRHGGIDPIAIFRAIWRGTILGRPEGASTIEMQIVRVVSGRYERTIRRKMREIALATLLAREIPKEDMPAIYLEIGYFGWRMNGFEAACRRLDLSSGAITINEIARLVARLKYPQPQANRPERWRQINARGKYLLILRAEHQSRDTYKNVAMDSQYG